MTIRPAGPFDLDLLAALHDRCFEEKWDREAYGRLLAGPGAAGFIATLDGEPCGFALARTAAGEAEILSLGVLAERRGRGIGRKLVEALAQAATEAGARHLFLEVAEDNDPARALYGHAGFVPVGRRRGYYRTRNGAVDALILRRTLAG